MTRVQTKVLFIKQLKKKKKKIYHNDTILYLYSQQSILYLILKNQDFFKTHFELETKMH